MAHNRYLRICSSKLFSFPGLSPARVLTLPASYFPWSLVSGLRYLPYPSAPFPTTPRYPLPYLFFSPPPYTISGININNLSITQPLKRSPRIAKHHSLTPFACAQTYIHCFNLFYLYLSNLIFLLKFIIVSWFHTFYPFYHRRPLLYADAS
ncbi:hypothetical protein K445DRAFT_238946 [Daldinia sp. EC12]|nr:hypothetical protein K445DRAFT_238946 [Daldinia sp. EC12]